MADFYVRIYLKNGQVIEFITDGFSINRETAKSGLKLGTFVMGRLTPSWCTSTITRSWS